MNDILDEVAPVKEMRVRDKDVPYMTSDWKSEIRAKRKATARDLKNKTQENWELRRRTRNAATKQRRIAIKEFWRKKTEDLKNNPKCFYKTFKPFLSTKDSTKGEEIHLNVNGSVIKDQKQVAEVLVEHFATLANGIGGDAAECNAMEDFKNGKQTINVNPVTQGQVLAVLESSNISIQPKVLKIGAEELSKPLTTLFNSCIGNSVSPSDWKRGDWTAVYKKDDKLSKENYRPITIDQLQSTNYNPTTCE